MSLLESQEGKFVALQAHSRLFTFEPYTYNILKQILDSLLWEATAARERTAQF
jgi:hypothetical protein